MPLEGQFINLEIESELGKLKRESGRFTQEFKAKVPAYYKTAGRIQSPNALNITENPEFLIEAARLVATGQVRLENGKDYFTNIIEALEIHDKLKGFLPSDEIYLAKPREIGVELSKTADSKTADSKRPAENPDREPSIKLVSAKEKREIQRQRQRVLSVLVTPLLLLIPPVREGLVQGIDSTNIDSLETIIANHYSVPLPDPADIDHRYVPGKKFQNLSQLTESILENYLIKDGDAYRPLDPESILDRAYAKRLAEIFIQEQGLVEGDSYKLSASLMLVESGDYFDKSRDAPALALALEERGFKRQEFTLKESKATRALSALERDLGGEVLTDDLNIRSLGERLLEANASVIDFKKGQQLYQYYDLKRVNKQDGDKLIPGINYAADLGIIERILRNIQPDGLAPGKLAVPNTIPITKELIEVLKNPNGNGLNSDRFTNFAILRLFYQDNYELVLKPRYVTPPPQQPN